MESTRRAAPKARLRTRTGCSICRSRRVKCGEERPACRNCVAGSRQCIWPGPDDALDRRRRSHREQQSPSTEPIASPAALSPRSVTTIRSPARNGSSSPSGDSALSSLILAPACPNLACTSTFSPAELDLVYHYLNVFTELLLLPTADPADMMGLSADIVRMMMQSGGVRSAVLASSASNKAALSKDARYQKIAFGYYAAAVKYVSDALGDLGRDPAGPSEALTTAVTFLYVYDLWGSDPELDARKHVTGAINLLKMRYPTTPRASSLFPTWNRVLTESVLYQAFFLAIRRPMSPNFDLDPDFFHDDDGTEHLGALGVANQQQSPVLGLPLPLYYLIVAVVKAQALSGDRREQRLSELREKVAFWERLIGHTTDEADLLASFETDAMTLFVLATSLLLDRASEPHGADAISPGETRWQVHAVLRVLQRPGVCELWKRCYLGAWPVLVVGCSVYEDRHVVLVRSVLGQMIERTGYGEFRRISEELEALWARRRLSREENGTHGWMNGIAGLEEVYEEQLVDNR